MYALKTPYIVFLSHSPELLSPKIQQWAYHHLKMFLIWWPWPLTFNLNILPLDLHTKRIWNRYTEKVPMDLFESKWDGNIPRYLLSLNTRFDAETTLLEHIWIDPELSRFTRFPIQVNGAVFKVQNAHYSWASLKIIFSGNNLYFHKY